MASFLAISLLGFTKILSKPSSDKIFLLNSPHSLVIKGEKVTKRGFSPKLNLSFNAIDVESLPPDQGTTQSYLDLF